MKVRIDTNLCNGTGLCQNTCARVFKLVNGVSVIRVVDVPPESQYHCKLAVQNCPNKAISIEVRELALYQRKTQA